MENSINLLRFNCLLSNRTLSGFKNVVLSFLSEFLIDHDNQEQNIKTCFDYVVNKKNITITYDVFNVYIGEAKNFLVRTDNSEIFVKLKDERYAEILKKIDEESLEAHIRKFISDKGLDSSKAESIIQILYHSIYLNIMSFDIKNIKSIITVDIQKKYEDEEIKLFNEFLEAPNPQKNNALFGVFLNAVEFAIISSGKGVKEYVKHIFKEKTYHLDTNVIVRLLGVGGEERKNGLLKLFEICHKQGVKFRLTKYTYKEINDILDGKISLLQSRIRKQGLAESVGDFVEDEHPIGFNNDFITHYSRAVNRERTVKDPESYRFHLKREIKKLEKKFDIEINYRISIDDKTINKVADLLRNGKKDLKKNVTYTQTAAKVDAANVIHVRNKRKGNNYNFQDIKDFYLTTDGLLNQILQRDNELLSETILPSQLFILHNGLFAEEDEIDYDLFVSFLKKRTTEFQLSGKEILLYIENIRRHTTHPEDAKEIIELFLQERYELGKKKNITEEDEIKVLEEVTKSYLQTKIEEQGEEVQQHRKIFENACKRFPVFLKQAKFFSYLIEFTVVALIGVLALLLTNGQTSLIILLVVLFASELARYLVSDRFNVFSLLIEKIYMWKVKNSEYYNISERDVYYLRKAEDELKK